MVKCIVYFCLALVVAVGCRGQRPDPAAALPALEQKEIEKIVRGCTVTIEFENKPICLGTIVAQRGSDCLVLSASDRLNEDEGYLIVHWQPDESGQRFLRREFPNAKIIKRELAQDLAVLQFECEKSLDSIPTVPTVEAMTTQTAFPAWSAKLVPLRPVDVQAVEVAGRPRAQDYERRMTSYWRLSDSIDPEMFGAPLIDKSGRLIGIAVKTALGFGLYCDDHELRKVVDGL